MSRDQRLAQLRDLVARLEQLPASEERERILREVRSRLVDVDTGMTPRAMRPVEEPPEVERRRPDSHRAAPPPPRPRPPAPVPADLTRAVDLLETAERLSLDDEDQPDGAWRRGLRG